jgi:hypothetical protein
MKNKYKKYIKKCTEIERERGREGERESGRAGGRDADL